MECKNFCELISNYIDSETCFTDDCHEIKALKKHLEECPECKCFMDMNQQFKAVIMSIKSTCSTRDSKLTKTIMMAIYNCACEDKNK